MNLPNVEATWNLQGEKGRGKFMLLQVLRSKPRFHMKFYTFGIQTLGLIISLSERALLYPCKVDHKLEYFYFFPSI